MHIYLPIAEVSVNWAVVLGLGISVGFLSGMLGVSGGFITTPLLMFYGIPAGVAVSTQASPIAAASLVGALKQGQRNSVDYKMGFVLMCGGTAGSAVGVYLFKLFQKVGQIDFVVQVSYVLLLGSVGGLMLREGLQAILAARGRVQAAKPALRRHTWIHNLPFKMRFRRSGLYTSAIPVVGLGFAVGILTAILGTGGAFLLIPAKIYLLRMRTTMAVGTSQFQMFVVAIVSTMMHAYTDYSVDIVLGLILVAGGVIGAQFGVGVGFRMRAEELRVALAALLVVIALRLSMELVLTPTHIYSVVTGQ
ncbi:MAG TPA: sulfite exporter TauE/SafE family protein [Rhizomicrobium sp.]|nr:sulfite exporter TauE/SafE family protein [Rhizomicrobium sp.]